MGLAAAAAPPLLLPWAGQRALLAFDGDLVLFVYLFALVRFATITAALDTGSSFEGMGASREAAFSALAEPALLLGARLPRPRGRQHLALHDAARPGNRGRRGAALLLTAGAAFVVLLAENARIPVDDPTTHLELTMIHEVMVLDHSGPDLAFIEYGSALKLWCFGGLTWPSCSVAASRGQAGWGRGPWLRAGGHGLCRDHGGVVESIMARLRLSRVPQLLVAALAMSALALALGFVRAMR